MNVKFSIFYLNFCWLDYMVFLLFDTGLIHMQTEFIGVKILVYKYWVYSKYLNSRCEREHRIK